MARTIPMSTGASYVEFVHGYPFCTSLMSIIGELDTIPAPRIRVQLLYSDVKYIVTVHTSLDSQLLFI